MKFKMNREWLAKRLGPSDDADVEVRAGYMSLDELRTDAQSRLVSNSLLRVPTQVGRVIRVARENKGWSIQDLAQESRVGLNDIVSLETDINYSPSPRTVYFLAEALHLAEDKLQGLVGHRIPVSHPIASNDPQVRFAANSRMAGSLDADEYEMVRLLVESITKNE